MVMKVCIISKLTVEVATFPNYSALCVLITLINPTSRLCSLGNQLYVFKLLSAILMTQNRR